jgi:hypothetical protein
MKIIQRQLANYEKCKEYRNGVERTIREKINFALGLREGEYLLRTTYNSVFSDGYLTFNSFFGDSIGISIRKHALWIKRDEIEELKKHMDNFKGCRLVKLSKNKK